MNGQSFYCLDCWACGEIIHLPARNDQQRCPHCGAKLTLEWHAERPEILNARMGPYVRLSTFTGVPIGDRSFTAAEIK